MNKFYTAIALSLALIASSAFGKTSDCFNPYQVRIVNQSGGPAELIRSKNISGIRKGNAINNYQSQNIMVDNLGAALTVEQGPEDRESVHRVTFYEKTGPIPTIILKGNAIEARGFNQKAGQQYTVQIRNESGGRAHVISSCEASIKGSIENNSTGSAKVRSGSTIVLNIGPKGSKKLYKIRFSTPVEGGNPMITLGQGGWFRSAISGNDIRFGASHQPQEKPTIKFGPKETGKKARAGACGRNRKADMHGA